MPETQPGASILDLCERICRLQQSLLNAAALPPVHWHALRYLARANRFSRTPGALGLYLGTTKGTVSQTLMALERRGMLEKSADGSDRRIVRLELTATGRALVAAMPLQCMLDAIEALDGERKAALARGLDDLLRTMIAANAGRSFGVCATCRHFRQNGATGEAGGPHRCGLLDVPLSEPDAAAICMEHTPAAA